MTDALIEYGLFVAKTLTLLVSCIGLIVLILRLRRSGGHDNGEHLEILDLNERYKSLARAVKESSMPEKAYRALLKQELRQEKIKAKAESKAASKTKDRSCGAARTRLFVIDFNGDLRASEVSGLRVLVSAVLLDHREGDAVLVRLENAGGGVSEHGLAASQLARLRARGVHLTVAVDKVAASGGYLMACVADRIVAAPFAVLGSIGVLAELPNFHRLLERHGVDFELHTAGEHKRTLTLFGENTNAAREKLREQLEETHTLFKSFVASYRPGLDLARVATGEYWHGQRAVDLGLVDAIATSDDLLLAASETQDLWQIKYNARKKPIERLLSNLQGGLVSILGKLPGL